MALHHIIAVDFYRYRTGGDKKKVEYHTRRRRDAQAQHIEALSVLVQEKKKVTCETIISGTGSSETLLQPPARSSFTWLHYIAWSSATILIALSSTASRDRMHMFGRMVLSHLEGSRDFLPEALKNSPCWTTGWEAATRQGMFEFFSPKQ